jgi:hypothetical protein
VAFEVQLQQSFAPLVAMAAMIHVQPYYPILATKFDEIAAELIAQVCATQDIAAAAQHFSPCSSTACRPGTSLAGP